MTTAWLVLGPSDHGVVILAEQLLRSCAAHRAAGPRVVRGSTLPALTRRLGDWETDVDSAHVHFTDQLFGPDCARAAVAYAELADHLRSQGLRLGVTLHDLPLDPHDPARYRRRADAYAAVATATGGPVIVSSHHEAALLAGFAPHVDPVVIPLPIDADPRRRRADGWDLPPTEVAVLGHLYPGKGHLAALEALVALPSSVGLTVLGRIAEGHDEQADLLRRRATQLGRRLTVTGWIAEIELSDRLRAPVIPFVGHERMSASGSIGSWLSAGRRPLVPDGRYTREIAARVPGGVTTYSPTTPGLGYALRRAYAQPGSTWLDPGVAVGPSSAEVAAAYRDAMVGVVGP